jgi:hypothetical protein
VNPRRAAAALVLAVAASACGVAVEEHSFEGVAVEEVEVRPVEPDPQGPPPGPPPAEEAELVEPTPGMADVRPVGWDEAAVDGAAVEVFWWSGVAPCTVLDRVEVEEDDETVTITLFEGRDASQGDVACIEIAQRKRTVVELSEPVGQRRLVDGADKA